MKYILLLLFILPLSFGCESEKPKDPELYMFMEMLVGSFDSSIQAQANSSYLDLTTETCRIWKDRPDYWVYTEQAMSIKVEKPYFQRIYKIERVDSLTIITRAFLVPNKKNFVGKWKKPKTFDQLTPKSLTERTGCEVYFKKTKTNVYSGQTNSQSCESSFEDVAYMVSSVTISEDDIKSQELGYDLEGNIIWGTPDDPYIFKRK